MFHSKGLTTGLVACGGLVVLGNERDKFGLEGVVAYAFLVVCISHGCLDHPLGQGVSQPLQTVDVFVLEFVAFTEHSPLDVETSQVHVPEAQTHGTDRLTDLSRHDLERVD